MPSPQESYGKLMDALVGGSAPAPKVRPKPKPKNTGASGTGRNAAQVIASQNRAKRKTSNQKPKTIKRRDAAAKAVKKASRRQTVPNQKVAKQIRSRSNHPNSQRPIKVNANGSSTRRASPTRHRAATAKRKLR